MVISAESKNGHIFSFFFIALVHICLFSCLSFSPLSRDEYYIQKKTSKLCSSGFDFCVSLVVCHLWQLETLFLWDPTSDFHVAFRFSHVRGPIVLKCALNIERCSSKSHSKPNCSLLVDAVTWKIKWLAVKDWNRAAALVEGKRSRKREKENKNAAGFQLGAPWGAQHRKRSRYIKNNKCKNTRQEHKRFRCPSVWQPSSHQH